MNRRALVPSTLLAALVVGGGHAAAATTAPPGDLSVRVFAQVGQPGQPEGLYVTPDRVVVTTHNADEGDTEVPSQLQLFDHGGTLVDTIVAEGQDVEGTNGLLGIARDANGRLYVADRTPARVLRVDPATGQQDTYASFADVPTCAAAGAEPNTGTDCSDAVVDQAPFPDEPVFAPDGTMYVTDLQQALIWRVPPNGDAEVWFTDQRLESTFGPNGIRFRADGTTLRFTLTTATADGLAGTGELLDLPVLADGAPGELTTVWTSQPGDGPDGFALAASGTTYVALAGSNAVAVVDADGTEVARVPASPLDNQLQDPPFDTPASVQFLGDEVLVTNQSLFTGTEANWVVFAIAAGEPGLSLFEPDLGVVDEQDGGPGTEDDGTVADDAGGGLAATGAGATALAAGALAMGTALRRRRPERR